MARTRTILVSATIALTLAVGVAYAQGGGFYGRADPELRAAMQSLEDAMSHLQNARNSGVSANARARAYIALAITELDPAYDSLRRPPAPPN